MQEWTGYSRSNATALGESLCNLLRMAVVLKAVVLKDSNQKIGVPNGPDSKRGHGRTGIGGAHPAKGRAAHGGAKRKQVSSGVLPNGQQVTSCLDLE